MNVMKNITVKQLCLIFTMILLPFFGFSQFAGDSIIIYIDNQVELKVAIPDYSDQQALARATAVLTEFTRLISDIEDQLDSDSPEFATYSTGGNITIEPGDPKQIYLVSDGTISNSGYRDRVALSNADVTILITTSDLSNISEFALSKCLEKAIALLPRGKNWSVSLYYECTGETIKELETKNNEFDFIEFSAGAGAGLVKNNWVADISFGLGLGFKHKGVLRHNPYVSASLLFDFDSEGKVQINTFLNIGFRWNLEKKTSKRNLLGVELGYLIGQQGNLFNDNTARLSMNWSPAKAIVVSPQLYATDNFKTFFPGIRIGFGF